MKKITIITGLPCSGKSTLALSLCQKNKKTIRINPQMLSEMIYKDHEGVLELAIGIAIEYIDKGYSVVIDDINLNKRDQELWRSLVDSYNNKVKFEQIDLRPKLNFCIFHDAWKPEGSLGFESINAMAMQYELMEKPPKEFVLFDIDSMMKDKLDAKHENYLKNMRLNPIEQSYFDLVKMLGVDGYKVVFYSSQPEKMRGLLMDWLNSYGLWKGDVGFTPVTIFVGLSEKEIYKTYFKNKYQIFKVATNNPGGWEKLGIYAESYPQK